LHERKVIEEMPWMYPESKVEFTKVMNDKAYIKQKVKKAFIIIMPVSI